MSNILIVFGQLAFDVALSILTVNPDALPQGKGLPSPALLTRALFLPLSKYDTDRLTGLKEAVTRLREKSRSFYLASSAFQGQIRTDLLLLYSFCRVADDLVDDASSSTEARAWISKLKTYLDLAYTKGSISTDYVNTNFPPETRSALLQLPIQKISRDPIDDLLKGFEMDLCFENESPIHVEGDLDLYAHRVAGTVAHMCIELILADYATTLDLPSQKRVIAAGDRMGIALQCVNIARDIAVDAAMNRVYIPRTWLAEEDITADFILKNPNGAIVEKLRSKLLAKAFTLHKGAKGAIEELPVEAKGPLRVAVESYMEIGRVLREPGYVVKKGRATVPKKRRLYVAWKTLREK